MESNEIARFTIQIHSTDNGTWQGVVGTESDSLSFKSKTQLLEWLYERFPELHPDKSEE